ncbi:MAG TPA: hypothetical protein VGO78_09095 [Acidimicrobiales bacterium]|nr:hypothetical protein [Acidimicrobiales bacterium]
MPRSVLAAVLAVRLLDESSAFVLPGTFESLRADLGLSYSQASSSFVAIAVGAVAGTAATVAADYRSRRWHAIRWCGWPAWSPCCWDPSTSRCWPS